MNITTVVAHSASALVYQVLSNLVTNVPNHRWETVSPRGMDTRELRWCWYRLEDTTQCAAWLPDRMLSYPFMVAEYLWMLTGSDDVEMISAYNANIAQFSDDGATFFGAYGPRWREQIGGAIERLKADETSRQAVTCTWRPEYNRDMNTDLWGVEPGAPPSYMNTKDVPCTVSMQYMIRRGKLETGVTMRSSDAWLGLPYDIFNFSMLARSVAAELGIEPGPLTMFIASSHLYERNRAKAEGVVEMWKHTGAAHMDRSRVVVPVPPRALEETEWFKTTEANLRSGQNTGFVEDFNRAAWLELLTMLRYRFRPDPGNIVGNLAQLVQP